MAIMSERPFPGRPTTPRRPTPSTRSGCSTGIGSRRSADRVAQAGRLATGRDCRREHPGRARQGRADPRLRQVCPHRGSRICDDEHGEVRSHLRCPYHAWGYALGRDAGHHAHDREGRDRPRGDLAVARPRRRLGRVRLRQPLSRRASAPARGPRRPAGRAPGAGPRSGCPGCGSAHHDQRGAGELEDRAGELQRVPALPDDPPRARRGGAGVQEGRHLRAAARTAASPWPTDAPRWSPTRGCGCRCSRLQGQGATQVDYGAGFYPTMFLDVDGRPAWPRRSSRPAPRTADW